MIFRQLFDAETSTYSYLLADENTREAVLIDAVDTQVERDLKLIDELGLKLAYALETHVHADHITGAGQLRERTGCSIGVSAHGQVACADLQLREGDTVRFGSQALRVIETPGHTDSCLTYYGEGMLFTGDSLMIRLCGRTDFQQGDAGRLYDSVTGKLFTLPEETFVYPGHDYRGHTRSTIGEERRLNARLTQQRDAFIKTMAELNLPMPKRINEAVPANLNCGLKHS